MEIDVSRVKESQPLARSKYRFPDAASASKRGLVGMGADFAPETIVAAYRGGIFPWPHPGEELLWFSPDPRAIIPIGGLHVSRRLARTLRQERLRVTVDAAFREVIRCCADRAEGTWITDGYRRGYERLHELGWAHSFEVWSADGQLAGGLYGLRVDGMFGAESMFYRERDASKVAMVAMMRWAEREGISLVDVQVRTDHTARMGAIEIRRLTYLRRLAAVVGPAQRAASPRR